MQVRAHRTFLSKHIKANIVNAGDGTHEHPTQALLDAFSIREKLGAVAGKKIAIIGDILHSRVALSNIFALQKLGAKLWYADLQHCFRNSSSHLGVEVEFDVKKALTMVRCCKRSTNPAGTSTDQIFSFSSRIFALLRH